MNAKSPPSFSFGEAIERYTRTDPKELAAVESESMRDSDIERLVAAFEAAAHRTPEGNEYWFARELQVLLGYSNWQNFEKVLARAADACRNSGQPIENHFEGVFTDVSKNPEGGRPAQDVKLSRYACYLITQNGDPRKKPVAFGQSYFAIQTRRQELADAQAIPSSEDEKRVMIRDQIKRHNKQLASAAKGAGVVTPQEFAIFQSNGYQGLYGGRTVPEIRRMRGLSENVNILDRMGSAELAANFFRVTQTEEKLRREQIKGKDKAYRTHFEVGRQVREAMLKISGVPPEKLPVADHVKDAAKRIMGKTTALPDGAPLPLVEEQPREVNLRLDLWKYALLVMATRDNGQISTKDLIEELPKYIRVPDGDQDILAGRKDSKFFQLVRNLKSHKTSSTNFIYQGYADAVPDGFKITARGLTFVQGYFK